MSHDLALLGGMAFVNGQVANANIYVSGGKVSKVSHSEEHADTRIDCRGLLILPGAIDSHVHFREPGNTRKEDWRSGSEAAAAGGVTCVFDMPNTKPETVTRKLLEEKIKLAEAKSLVDFGMHFGATNTNQEEILHVKRAHSVKFYMASTTGDLLIHDEAAIAKHFRILHERGMLAFAHAEDERMVAEATKLVRESGKEGIMAHAACRPPEAAVRGMETAVKLAKAAKARLHLTHVSTAGEIEVLKKAKKAGLQVTADTTPTYLFISQSHLTRGGNYLKVNPPVRSEEDRKAAFAAFAAGVFDVVATDHAPHLRDEKEKPFWDVPGGVPGVETLLPLLLNEVNRGTVSLGRVVSAVCGNPAKLFELNKGEIAVGKDADFAVIDMKKDWVIRDEMMHSKCGWTPFNGMRVQGRVEKTFVRGNLAYDEGVFSGRQLGRCVY